VIRTAQSALGHGCRKLDLFFMVGLPRQTRESALANIDFCEDIHRACGMDKRLYYFVAPLAPFLDPAARPSKSPRASASSAWPPLWPIIYATSRPPAGSSS